MTIRAGEPQVMAGNNNSLFLVKAKKDVSRTSATPPISNDPASTGVEMHYLAL